MPPDAGNAQVRFDVIGRAWGLYQSQMGMWIAIGALVLIVGAIFTMPFYFLSIALLYNDFVQRAAEA